MKVLKLAGFSFIASLIAFFLGWMSLQFSPHFKTEGWSVFSRLSSDLVVSYAFHFDTQQELDLKGVRVLKVEGVSTDIKVSGVNGPTSHLEFKGHAIGHADASGEEKPWILERDGDVLVIRFDEPHEGSSFKLHQNKKPTRARIEISRDLKLAVQVKGVSSDIQIENLTSPSLQVSSVSGEVEVSTVTESLQVETTSGDIEIDLLERAPKAQVASVSGSVVFTASKMQDVVSAWVKTVSGELSSSGRWLLNQSEEDSRIKIKTISGDVKLTEKD